MTQHRNLPVITVSISERGRRLLRKVNSKHVKHYKQKVSLKSSLDLCVVNELHNTCSIHELSDDPDYTLMRDFKNNLEWERPNVPITYDDPTSEERLGAQSERAGRTRAQSLMHTRISEPCIMALKMWQEHRYNKRDDINYNPDLSRSEKRMLLKQINVSIPDLLQEILIHGFANYLRFAIDLTDEERGDIKYILDNILNTDDTDANVDYAA